MTEKLWVSFVGTSVPNKSVVWAILSSTRRTISPIYIPDIIFSKCCKTTPSNLTFQKRRNVVIKPVRMTTYIDTYIVCIHIMSKVVSDLDIGGHYSQSCLWIYECRRPKTIVRVPVGRGLDYHRLAPHRQTCVEVQMSGNCPTQYWWPVTSH